MKALVKKLPQPGLWLEELPLPDYGADEVRIRVQKTAICGTDVHIYNWDSWAAGAVACPITIGHEFMGYIDAVGENVSTYKVGDRVTAEGHIVCGRCRNCLAGRGHNCQNSKGLGIKRPGAFAEYVVVPCGNLWPLPEEISTAVAACFDPLGNAVHSALSFDLRGEDVLLTGAGPLGLMGGAVARFCGARNVVVSDINPYRLQIAQNMGLTTVDPSEIPIAEFAQKLGLKEGFDVAIEMSGSTAALEDITQNVVHGGKIAMLGLFQKNVATDWNKIIFSGLTFKGVSGREMFETWYKMTALVQAGLDIAPIITHVFPYAEYETAFNILRSGKSGKILLDWN